jgi:DNA-cytosine methyltransferase
MQDPSAEQILRKLQDEIDARGLSPREAATAIGTTPGSLQRHLNGHYVRSDSMAKYRRWLAGDQSAAVVAERPREERREVDEIAPPTLVESPPSGADPFRVVDLFSGSGGLSLGFEHGQAGAFKVSMALEIEGSLVANYNANAADRTVVDPCVRVDLADFLNEAEILAFYLDRVRHEPGQESLADNLENLPTGSLTAFQQQVTELDAWYLAELRRIREAKGWSTPPGDALRQTSVIGFHRSLGLPVGAPQPQAFPPLAWRPPGGPDMSVARPPEEGPPAEMVERLEELWSVELNRLRARSEVRPGKGQLATSAKRIGEFVKFIDSGAYDGVKRAWMAWRGLRQSLRDRMFGGGATLDALRTLYGDGREVQVVLGGPPCQGFSRIGRGKIRSLREDGVQVHADEEAGDLRNRLLFSYVQFVGALRPKVFLFENVRHFQSSVKTDEGQFDATTVLADAIRDISTDHLQYEVSQSILNAAEHGVPQMRERYFMCGVRGAASLPGGIDPASWVLDLPRTGPVPLRVALSGLGDARFRGGRGNKSRLSDLTEVSRVSGVSLTERRYLDWVTMTRDGSARTSETDAHQARVPRQDDAAWFRLMAPGTRWMDYRADSSRTLERLRRLFDQVESRLGSEAADPADEELIGEVRAMKAVVDGSLPLRLLLEQIGPMPGEETHHLSTASYLHKKDGNHGDWLARLDGERPCKTIVSHMAKDTYAYVHPYQARTLSVREAARVQTFPDWFSFGGLSLVDAFRAVGNAVPPFLASQLAGRVAQVLWLAADQEDGGSTPVTELAAVAAAGQA